MVIIIECSSLYGYGVQCPAWCRVAMGAVTCHSLGPCRSCQARRWLEFLSHPIGEYNLHGYNFGRNCTSWLKKKAAVRTIIENLLKQHAKWQKVMKHLSLYLIQFNNGTAHQRLQSHRLASAWKSMFTFQKPLELLYIIWSLRIMSTIKEIWVN